MVEGPLSYFFLKLWPTKRSAVTSRPEVSTACTGRLRIFYGVLAGSEAERGSVKQGQTRVQVLSFFGGGGGKMATEQTYTWWQQQGDKDDDDVNQVI